jgi:solute carrier family 25 S-adenosylmethionine transporter 26
LTAKFNYDDLTISLKRYIIMKSGRTACLLLASLLIATASSHAPLLLLRGGGARLRKDAITVSPKPQQPNDNGPIQTFVRTIQDAKRHLIAAAAARSSSIFLMYPVDTIKTRIQMEQPNALRLSGLYKGVGGSLLGQVPYGVLTFGSYEMYKRALLNKFPNAKPVFMYAIAAIMGDLTGSGWLCPSEVVKQQLQAGMYSSTSQAVSTILQKKGIVGLYQGYFGGIARDVPFRVSQLCSYEVTKNLYLRIKSRNMAIERKKLGKRSNILVTTPLELSPLETAVCGAVSGSFSAAVTAPLDRIKTLLMTDSAAYGGTVASCAAHIWRQRGLPGFFEGVVPRVVYIAPSVVCFFLVYEQVQQRLP